MTIRYTSLLLALLTSSELCLAQTVIGIVGDGPQPRPTVPLDLLQNEIADLVRGEFDVTLPESKRLDGNWTLEGVRGAIRRQLEDPDVDIIITTGVVASNEAARMQSLNKPVIAAVVADAQLQAFPVARAGNRVVSGKPNFVYLARVRLEGEGDVTFGTTNIDEAIDTFFNAVRFEHLAVLADQLTLDSIPVLEQRKAPEVSSRLGASVTVIPVTDSAQSALNAIPMDADAVLVGPLLRLGTSGLRELADGLIARQLPSFSLLGRSELEYGLLMASGGREQDGIRYARRLALDVQSILLGDAPSEIDVAFAEPQRLAINMRTAEAIRFSPRYAVLADAEQLFSDELAGESLSLAEAMAESLESNLELRAAAVEPLLAGEDVSLARAQLWPQLGFGTGAVRIDADRANPLFQAERTVDAQISGSQILYSDDARAALMIARYLDVAADQGYQISVLDTLHSAARAYLTVLRAAALETVQRSNLEVTRRNLELARVRESIGFSGRGDVLRWESQLATDRQDLIARESDRRVATTDLNRILNRSQNQPLVPAGEDVARSIALFEDDRFRAFIDNAAVWETFQNFLVQQTLQQSPELMQQDQLIAAQERQVLAARRKYYVPELTLSGTRGTVISRGGAGSNVSALGVDDYTWAIALDANWPLLTGGALRARVSQNRYALTQLERQRAALAEGLEARTRAALHRAAGSYPAVELSMDAARAAGENLALVTDAYVRGAVSVTELIDAQNAALASDLRAADAQYAYLIDVVDILRSTADFSLLLDRESTELWFREVEAYFREREVMPRR